MREDAARRLNVMLRLPEPLTYFVGPDLRASSHSRYLLIHHDDLHLFPIAPNFRHIHRVSEHRQRVKLARRFGAHFVANLPHAFGQFVEEQGDFAVAEFLIHEACIEG